MQEKRIVASRIPDVQEYVALLEELHNCLKKLHFDLLSMELDFLRVLNRGREYKLESVTEFAFQDWESAVKRLKASTNEPTTKGVFTILRNQVMLDFAKKVQAFRKQTADVGTSVYEAFLDIRDPAFPAPHTVYETTLLDMIHLGENGTADKLALIEQKAKKAMRPAMLLYLKNHKELVTASERIMTDVIAGANWDQERIDSWVHRDFTDQEDQIEKGIGYMLSPEESRNLNEPTYLDGWRNVRAMLSLEFLRELNNAREKSVAPFNEWLRKALTKYPELNEDQ
jgi:hypothetical protein